MRRGFGFGLLLLSLLYALGLYLGPPYSPPGVRRYRWIVIHHSAARKGDYASIRDYHVRVRGWSDAAYHLIFSNGSTDVPAGHLEATGRFLSAGPAAATRSRPHNLGGIHLCLIGNYDEMSFPESLRPAFGHALSLLQESFAIADEDVLFHGADCSPTRCPGKYLTKPKVLSWKAEAGRCPPEVRAQHRAVLLQGVQAARKGVGRLTAAVLTLLALLGVAFLLWPSRPSRLA